jgi:hypothetical protein
MTANAPIDIEKEFYSLPCDNDDGEIDIDEMVKLARSIAERVEAQTIERGTAAQDDGWKFSSLTRFYAPSSTDTKEASK